MAETKARFLANLIGATSTDNDFTLPNVAVSGTNDKVLTSGGDGTVSWETTLQAPSITQVTTPASDNSINEDDNVVMTVTGANFSSTGMTAKLVDASNVGVTVTGHDTSDLSINFTSSNSVSVTTRAATANISQSNVKLVLSKSGLAATSASIGVSPDPTFTSINNPHVYLTDNLGSGQNVGSAISASASDSASIAYTISGATSVGNTYAISSGGQITTSSEIADVSSGVSYNETPVVTATAGGDSTRVHTLNVPLVIIKATHTFSYTGSLQTFAIPTGATSATAYMWGAGGGGASHSKGGAGGYASAVINLSGLSNLYLVVGQGGSPKDTQGYSGANGGGLSGIFSSNTISQANAILVSGSGGGSAGGNEGGAGGGGGGANLSGTDGDSDARTGGAEGHGGTTSAGGAAATGNGSWVSTTAQAGSALTGGDGAVPQNGTSNVLKTSNYLQGGRSTDTNGGFYAGGGGGSGYYGGGGGWSGYGGGGGGGSGYANTSICSSVSGTSGSAGNTTAPENSNTHYASGIAVGGNNSSLTTAGTAGGNGRIVLVLSTS